MDSTHLVLALAMASVAAAWAAAAPAAVLKADFARDPARAGWAGGAPPTQRFDGEWAGTDEAGGRYLLVRRGYWQSPAISVTPFEYYRLRFRAKAKTDGYWVAVFFDAEGAESAADCYDSLPGSSDWRRHERCFRANAGSVTARLRFVARRSPVAVDNVRVERIGRAAAAKWADKLRDSLPPVDYRPPAERWKLLPKSIGRLREGKTLRVVLLGDSIANDTSHSAFDVLLERAYPGSRVEVVNSVRGGTGCGYYKGAGRIRQYVLSYRPDLLIIAGISNGYDAEPIRSVIRQVRAESGCEIMLLTGAVCPRQRCEASFAEHGGLPVDEACRIIEAYAGRLAAMAAEEKVELLDMRTAWDDYVLASPRPQMWFMRDEVHANVRGKCVLGRILLRYFQPRKEAAR